jgi:hypothetical protein
MSEVLSETVALADLKGMSIQKLLDMPVGSATHRSQKASDAAAVGPVRHLQG